MDISILTKNLKQILEQTQIINNIHAALSITNKIEDVSSIIMSALISKHGLDFSRSFLFLYNPKTECLEGKYALGPSTEEEAKEFFEEQNIEEKYLNGLLENINGKDTKDNIISNITDTLYSNLRSSAVWIDSLQKHGLENELTNQISKHCFPVTVKKKGKKNFLTQVLEQKQCIKIDVIKNKNLFPKDLLKIFDKTIAAVILKTKKGIKAIIVVDRKFSSRDIDLIDIKNLEWFGIHSALAIENAELFNDLENAYKELKEVEKLKTNFISIISHELRTPLTSILGFVELISKEKVGSLNDQQKELLQRVSKNTFHLVHMVNDLIQLAELEAEGLMEIKLTPIDPLSCFMGILPKLEQRRKTRRVDVEVNFKEPPPKIISDERTLEKILYHLLDNAIKFSPEHEKVIIHFDRDDKKLVITVEDHGIGIPKEKLRKIFDSFYQVDSSLSRSYEGLGVGLSIIRLLLSSSNGEIDVHSEVGVGSKFIIKYPIAE